MNASLLPAPGSGGGATALPGPVIGPWERLSATLALSLVGFGVLILGIGFVRNEAAPVVPTGRMASATIPAAIAPHT